jgi:hypothetical protein
MGRPHRGQAGPGPHRFRPRPCPRAGRYRPHDHRRTAGRRRPRQHPREHRRHRIRSAQQVGGSIGVAIIGVVFFRTTGTRETPASIQAAFIAATWVCVGAYVLAAIISVFLPTRREILALAERRSQFAEES